MIKYKHFIITFFNIRLVEQWHEDKKKSPTQTEEWLSKRFNLFETFCFPSVKAQTDKDFTWLCLFDVNTPEKYKNKITAYQNDFPLFQPHFIGDGTLNDAAKYLQGVISSLVTADDQFIITTNLDNDDSIHCSMIKKIHSLLNESPQEGLYSFHKGIQYFSNLNMAFKMVYPHNHFLTLVENNSADFKTIESYFHGSAHRSLKTVVIKDTNYYWMEVVHNNNVSNDFRITTRIKYYPVFTSLSLKDYGVNITIRWYHSTFNTLIKMPWVFFSVAFRKLNNKAKRKLFKKK